MLFSEGGSGWVEARVCVAGWHEELGPDEQVVLLRVVLEHHHIVVCAWPVSETL